MRKLRRVPETEVIAEFLRAEFYHEEFHCDRETFADLVLCGNLADSKENALRRALLFRRRGHMWRELPADTQWWEVEIEDRDIERMCVFPRAQWRQIADGDFLLKRIVRRLRSGAFPGRSREFVAKLQAFSDRLRIEQEVSCVLLIGVNENQRTTILEGNHRLTAALLASETLLQSRFRVFGGFSPRMSESCWYETNLPNLWRYAKNRMKNFLYDPEADVQWVLDGCNGEAENLVAVGSLENAAATRKVSGSK